MKIGFVGVGNMGSALLRTAVKNQQHQYFATDVSENGQKVVRELGIQLVDSCCELAKTTDIVILCIKPKDVELVLRQMREQLQNKALLSIVAGVRYAQLQVLVDNSTRILTALPNLPIGYSNGLIGITASESSFTAEEIKLTQQLFSSAARIIEVPEKLLGVFSAVAGSGPAFIAMMAEAMADAAVQQGLPRSQSYEIVAATLAGTGEMLLQSGKLPAQVKDEVSSPGGLTIIGVAELESHNFRSAIIKAIQETSKAWK